LFKVPCLRFNDSDSIPSLTASQANRVIFCFAGPFLFRAAGVVGAFVVELDTEWLD